MSKKDKWNFDEIIDRQGTYSVKWDHEFMEMLFKRGDLLPLWVADMDFKAPDALLNALKKRVDHGIFGYTYSKDPYYQSIINWFKRRHNWKLEKDWIKVCPGVVPAINFIIHGFTKPGDNVIIQKPVYYPFASSIKNNGRITLNNELVNKENHYEINFKDLEEKCKQPRTKLFILCSPHNPVGRVWTKNELKQMGEICIDNNVLVVPDEIHCDLIFEGHKHIPFASISKKFAQNSITCVAPSKTFNVAGLKASNVIIPNEKLRNEFTTITTNASIRGLSIFGYLTTEVVYNECEDWLEELLVYLWKNFLFLKDFFEMHLPTVKVLNLEGTYLPWVDFRPLNIDPKILDEIIKKDAKVGLDDGAMFGESGAGFQRFNIACPKAILQDALEKIRDAILNHQKKKSS
ncbi:MAG: pyridoxal phosphate-dependent aminotransferase [Asgard group archaeon]|nr:pyridoxal phosphate-dependent aminotransferase [Asgard group archaeon]